MTQIPRAAEWAWLSTPEGEALLSEAAQLPADRLTRITRLRARYSVEIATAAVELLELRHRAKAKFAQSNRMFFTPEGLEQSTGDVIAHYRASRFPPGAPVLDACCGIGGDALALAVCAPVLAVDLNPAATACTSLNTSRIRGQFPVHTLCADVTQLDLRRLAASGVGAAYFDPSRRGDREGGRRRVRDAADYAPPLDWLEALREAFPAVGVKVAPSLEDRLLHRPDARVEFISDRGECKEAVLWFGALGDALPPATVPAGEEAYYATLLRSGQEPITLAPAVCALPTLSTPLAYLYEPDPAVIRAHRVPQVAAMLNAHPMDYQIAYLTAEQRVSTPFATSYRVLDWMPFQLKAVQARLRALKRTVVAIKKRSVPLEPEELRKRLTGTGQAGDAAAVIVLTRMADKVIAILCETIPQAIHEPVSL